MKGSKLTLVLMCLMNAFFICQAGPVAWGACQTACNSAAVYCYAQAGLVFGAFTLGSAATGPVGWLAWLTGGSSVSAAAAACSAAQGVCMAACTPLLVAPSP